MRSFEEDRFRCYGRRLCLDRPEITSQKVNPKLFYISICDQGYTETVLTCTSPLNQ